MAHCILTKSILSIARQVGNSSYRKVRMVSETPSGTQVKLICLSPENIRDIQRGVQRFCLIIVDTKNRKQLFITPERGQL